MESTKIKIKEIYLPFLLVAMGTILLYNLFRWTVDIKLGILPLKDDLWNFWLPFVLPWIPILIWLRRRIRLLHIRGSNDNGYFGYQLIMAMAIAIPLIISQYYMETSSFDLVTTHTIDGVKKLSNEKYFKINSFQVEKNLQPYITSRTSGKNNETLTFFLYLSCSFENTNNVWYGVQFRKVLSNRISEEKKESEYLEFLENSERDFEFYNFQHAKYFEKLGYSNDRDGFLEAIKKTNSHINEKEQIILIPKFNNFDERRGASLPWVFGSFGIGALVLVILVLIPRIDEEELRNFKKGKSLKEDGLKEFIEVLDPRGANSGTAILLLLNISVFVIMIFSGIDIISPTPEELLELGGNRRHEVLSGEYWRLLTSIFIHGGLMHLIMNLFGLGLGAMILEGILGRFRLVVSFLICGVLASLTSVFWHENIISVGASGAIFGLYGILLAFTIFKIFSIQASRMNWALLGLYVGVSLLFGLFGGIDNAAHIGGLISGFGIGVLLISSEKDTLKKNAG